MVAVLGWRKLVNHLQQCGTQRLVATVLAETKRMLELAHDLGFSRSARQPGDDTVAIELALHWSAAADQLTGQVSGSLRGPGLQCDPVKALGRSAPGILECQGVAGRLQRRQGLQRCLQDEGNVHVA